MVKVYLLKAKDKMGFAEKQVIYISTKDLKNTPEQKFSKKYKNSGWDLNSISVEEITDGYEIKSH